MPDRPVRVGLAGDDQAHRLLMENLADAATPGLDDLENRRKFVGDGRGGAYLKTGTRPPRDTAPSGRPRYRSQRSGSTSLGYGAMLVEVAQDLAHRVDVVLVLVDEDGHPERIREVAAALVHLQERGLRRVALGVCNPIAEAWLVALLAPSRPRRLHMLASELGFDVTRHPHKLTSKPGTARHHGKRALHFVLDEASDVIMAYPAETPKVRVTEPNIALIEVDPKMVAELKECGLAMFFCQLLEVYAPMVVG